MSLFFVCLPACGSDLLGQDDGFRRRLMAGCRTEDECLRLRAEAQARVDDCEPNMIGKVRCTDARVDRHRADELLRNQRLKTQALVDELRRREQADDARLRQAAEAQRQTAALEAQRAEQARSDKEIDDAWSALDRAKCSGQGDPVACQDLQEFIFKYRGSKYTEVAEATLAQGRQLILERQRREEERQSKGGSAGAPSSSTSSGASAGAPSSSTSSGTRAKCCDGTLSPSCGCGGGRGCCSHHGGVCGCD